jgi:hypothetical protein
MGSASTARSKRHEALPSILLKETPVDPTIFDRRDPLEKFLDKKKDSIKNAPIPSVIDHLTSYDDDDL